MGEEEKTAEAKERILEAAIRLFARRGYAGTGMRELANEAGVNLAMINYYFGSKLGLLEAVFDAYFEHHVELMQIMTREDLEPEEAIRQGMRKLVEVFRANPDLVRVAFAEIPYDLPEFAEYKADKIRATIQPALMKLLPAIQSKSPRQVDPIAVGAALFAPPVFHFLIRPVLERVFELSLDDDFYHDYPERLANLFLYGVFGAGEASK